VSEREREEERRRREREREGGGGERERLGQSFLASDYKRDVSVFSFACFFFFFR
jgi:hypothetical protein